jgi:hypothetical protein
MGYVQDNAEVAVRDMLREAAERLVMGGAAVDPGTDVHSFTFRLNLCRFGHTSPCPPV